MYLAAEWWQLALLVEYDLIRQLEEMEILKAMAGANTPH